MPRFSCIYSTLPEAAIPLKPLKQAVGFRSLVGHKLEALTQYQLRHGEAVSIGVALDTVYSSLAFGLESETVRETLQTLQRLHLPIYDPWLDKEAIFQGLEEFRQHLGGRLTLTMLASLGKPIDVHEVDYGPDEKSRSHPQTTATNSRRGIGIRGIGIRGIGILPVESKRFSQARSLCHVIEASHPSVDRRLVCQ